MILEIIDRLAGRWLDWRLDRSMKRKSDIEIERIKYERGEIGVMAIAPDVVYLADQCANLLEKNNAKNYIQFDMMPRIDRGLQPIRVTVQWANGMSPAVKAANLEKQLREIEDSRR